MKRFLLLIFLCAAGCSSKHKDPGFTSVAGKWTYTTPDNKVAVTFELAKSASGDVSLQNQTMKLDGTQYESAAQMTGVNIPTIQKIRINANDIKAIYNYSIEFDNCTVSSDFKTISVDTANYIWPWGTNKPLADIVITRF